MIKIKLNFWAKIMLCSASLASLYFANFGSRETALKIDFITEDYASGKMAIQTLGGLRKNVVYSISVELNVDQDALHLCSFVPTKHLVYLENGDTFHLSSIFKAASNDSICINLNLPDIDALLTLHLNNVVKLKIDAAQERYPNQSESSEPSRLFPGQLKILGWRFFYIPKFSYLTGAISAGLVLLSFWLITAMPGAKQLPLSELKNADK